MRYLSSYWVLGLLSTALLFISQTAMAKTADAPFFYTSEIGIPSCYSPDSLRELRLRADAGEAEAMLILGEVACDAQVKGYEQWLRRAAEKGNPRAQMLMGLFLLHSYSNPEEALVFLQQAADQGETTAVSYLIEDAWEQDELLPLPRLEQWLLKALAKVPLQVDAMEVLRQYPVQEVA